MPTITDPQKIDEVLTRGVEKIYPSREELEKVLLSGKRLKLYQGFDPSGIQLHIGHMAGLRKLRQWQELGHHVIFLIGDGTGQAGDPSGKTRAREKYLTREELRANAKDYVLQAKKIVSFEGINPAEILYNSDWLNKLSLVDILNMAQHFSLQQLEERDIFVERKKRGEPVNLREFLYPLLQGYDSVAMNVDLEIGGSDQTFNMLCGRQLVKEVLGKEKFVMTTPLLTDSHGHKIGKTEGNVIALTAPANDFYGAVMSLGDNVIARCFEYLTDLPMAEVNKISSALQKGENPMIYKKRLAFTLTAMLNSEAEATKAQRDFEKTFQQRELPRDIPVFSLNSTATISEALLATHSAASRTEAKRLVNEGAVEINGVVVRNPQALLPKQAENIIKVGKRKFLKVVAPNH